MSAEHDAALSRYFDRLLHDTSNVARAAALDGVKIGLTHTADWLEEMANDPRVIEAAKRSPTALVKWLAERLREKAST